MTLRNLNLPLAGLLVSAALATPAFAQEESLGRILTKMDAAPADSPVAASSTVEVSAGSADGTATLRIAAPNGPFRDWSFAITTPTDSDGAATVVALTGLPDATTFELRYSGVIGGGSPLPGVYESTEFKALCVRMAQRKDPKVTTFDDVESCESTDFKGVELREFQGLIAPPGTVWFVGFGSKLGYHDFDYLNPATLAEDSERHTEWSVSGHVAAYLPNAPMLISLSGAYTEAYEAQDKGTLCPLGPGPVLTCVTGPIGAPGRTRRASLALEARGQWGSVAFAPRVVRDFENDVTGVDLPIYFVPDEAGGLSGGVRLGWRDDTGDVTAGVFVSKAFTLVPF